MTDVMNEYELLAPFQNENAGFSRWTYAVKEGRTYFVKEFLDPVYPTEESLSLTLCKQRILDCEEYEKRKKFLYEKINNVSDGNLVRIFEFFRCDNHYYISTDKIIGEKIAFDKIGEIPFENRLFLCKSIAHSMMRLHQVHIVHADIKENNILIKKTKTEKYVGKIIDFDASFFENDPPKSEDELGGDQVYLAPEACQFICGDSIDLTCKIDVFSLGLLFHQYLTGKMPEYDISKYDYAFEAVLDGQALCCSKELPLPLQSVITGMLERDPEKRPHMEDVYDFFKALDSPDEINKNSNEGINEGEEKRNSVNYDKEDWFHRAGDL